MPWDKMPTKEQWSKAKTDCGADKLIRDQWHIGEHLKEYHALGKDKGVDKYFKLTDLESKFQRYKAELAGKDSKKSCTQLISDITGLLTKIKGKRDKILVKYPELKKYVEGQQAKVKAIYSSVDLGGDI